MKLQIASQKTLQCFATADVLFEEGKPDNYNRQKFIKRVWKCQKNWWVSFLLLLCFVNLAASSDARLITKRQTPTRKARIMACTSYVELLKVLDARRSAENFRSQNRIEGWHRKFRLAIDVTESALQSYQNLTEFVLGDICPLQNTIRIRTSTRRDRTHAMRL